MSTQLATWFIACERGHVIAEFLLFFICMGCGIIFIHQLELDSATWFIAKGGFIAEFLLFGSVGVFCQIFMKLRAVFGLSGCCWQWQWIVDDCKMRNWLQNYVFWMFICVLSGCGADLLSF
ncbi:uncharacterized protein LOC131253092 isoform X2 [Magnolia sinica]|uniref:uncharacterized protein LOC131253092 isoform X2 n=1 Tax=Magnolia sinica TaxID=86752 RepID=UPI00265829B0|nr:uncharacterized protein LOC131253092 isoform X2 [Magnolia sinica]